MTLLLVAVGGALGAVARYLLDVRIVSRGVGRIPLGTFAVNVSGSLGLGMLVGALGTAGGPDWVVTFVGAGFLAAYTTFSTWMYEAARLVQRGSYGAALAHLLGTVVLGVLAAVVGVLAGSALGGFV